MKKLIAVSVFTAFIMGVASNASASWWGSNNDYECYGPYGKIPGCNPYDEWDPRYWLEEMDITNNDDDYYRYGGYGYGGGYPYRGGYAPQPYYGGGGYAPQPYGGYQQPYYGGGAYPYAAPAPAPVAPAPAAPAQ